MGHGAATPSLPLPAQGAVDPQPRCLDGRVSATRSRCPKPFPSFQPGVVVAASPKNKRKKGLFLITKARVTVAIGAFE